MCDGAAASRRDILRAAAAAGLAGSAPGLAAAKPPSETRRLRLVKFPSVYQAPVFVADEQLRGKGFSDISYVDAVVPGAGPGASYLCSPRLREAGMEKNAPQKIIAEGTDWRILEQLKREMKT